MMLELVNAMEDVEGSRVKVRLGSALVGACLIVAISNGGAVTRDSSATREPSQWHSLDQKWIYLRSG